MDHRGTELTFRDFYKQEPRGEALVHRVAELARRVNNGEALVETLVVACRLLRHEFDGPTPPPRYSVSDDLYLRANTEPFSDPKKVEERRASPMHTVLTAGGFIAATADQIRFLYGSDTNPIANELGNYGLAILPDELPASAALVLLYEISTPVAWLVSDIRRSEDPAQRIGMLVDRVRRRSASPSSTAN